MHIFVLFSLENMVLKLLLPNEIEKSINYPDLNNKLLGDLDLNKREWLICRTNVHQFL